jgi:hypothetical protein
MFKLVISFCASTLFFGAVQADVVSTLNFTPSGSTSPITITAGGTVDFELDLTFAPSPQTPLGDPMFFNITGGIVEPVASCTGVIDCQEVQYFNSASTLFSFSDYLEWQTVPGQFPGEGGVVPLTALGVSSFSLTYPNPGYYEIFTYGSYPPPEELIYELDCVTDYVNGAATGPAQCSALEDRQVQGAFDTALIAVNVLPGEAVPEPSYRILLTALLGVLFVPRRRTQSTKARRPAWRYPAGVQL